MLRRFENRSWLATIAIVGLLGLAWGGCANRTELPTAPEVRSARVMASQADPPRERNQEDKPKTTVDYCTPFTPFANARFSNPTNINNPWLPLIPGTQYVLTGQANRGLGVKPHDVIFTVTDVIKTINGIDCVVLWDRDFQEDPNNPGGFILAEAELAFFAQDDNGNVWMMGEYPEEFDITSGEFLGAPNTWIPGIDGTEAGTLMLGNPKNGTGGYYLQARAPAIRFLDCAKVWKMGETMTVPVGTFTNVMVTDERAPADWRGGHQQKFYARGVGNIAVDFVGDPEGEVLAMTSRRTLNATELFEARQAVLQLDDRGYQFNDVYLQTVRAR